MANATDRTLACLRANRVPFAVMALMFIVLLARFAPLLPTGTLERYDEFHTMDRTLSVLQTGDMLTIQSNHLPNFHKPPLQYWLGAGLLAVGFDPERALRLPSFVAALGCLVLTGVLAALLVPAEAAIAASSAMLFLAGSRLYWGLATSALLDSGAGFFTVAAAVALFAALRRPAWCWAVALAVGLGMLQKSPVAALFVAVALIALAVVQPLSLALLATAPHRRTSLLALGLALGLIAAWPALQVLLHGTMAFRSGIGNEMVDRFRPGDPFSLGDKLLRWMRWLSKASSVIWWPALIATLGLPFVLRQPIAIAMAAWAAVFFVAMTLASGAIYDRYLTNVLPFLAVGLTAWLLRVVRRPVWVLTAAAVLSVLSGGLFVSVGTDKPVVLDMMPMLVQFRASVQPGESLASCRWTEQGRSLYPGALSVYASPGPPIAVITAPDAIASDVPVRGPLRGLCPAADFAVMAPHLAAPHVVAQFGDFVIWTADGPAP